MGRIKSNFSTWSSEKKEQHCAALNSPTDAGMAWDVHELWRGGSKPFAGPDYRPPCGTPQRCADSVMVNDQCYYAGSVNYVIYGVMTRLCGGSRTLMWRKVEAWKVILPAMMGDQPGANFVTAQSWADAGYQGWPLTTQPRPDRISCVQKCPKPWSKRFTYRWLPDEVAGPTEIRIRPFNPGEKGD